jgi:hypothetical protein
MWRAVCCRGLRRGVPGLRPISLSLQGFSEPIGSWTGRGSLHCLIFTIPDICGANMGAGYDQSVLHFFPSGVTTMKRNLKTLLLAATAGAMMTMAAGAMAQAPAGGPGAGPPGGGPGRGGFGGPVDRASTIQRFGLGDASLKLTDAQKGEIDKAADAYVAAMGKVPAAAPGGPPSPEVQAARTKARDDFTAAVNKVLNDEQRKTFEAAQASRRGGPGGGMGGPPGGGAPGGGRPPGQ